ncbi:MAG: energy-coupled thiamine transporter ThiT [Ruminococcus sp.]|jgi:thiamine transporter|nr:energy-coupled thiamine transporter ThiT [Ruminococcus sp.]
MSQTNSIAGRSTSSAVKKLIYAAMGIALGMVTSYIKVWDMPMGGSVTLLSMLFICLIGYWFGPRYGIVTGAAFGILQFLIDPYVLSIPQVLFDYPLAFGALGLSGFFSNRKYGLQIGYVVGVLGRFIFSTLSGVIFFAAYAPEGMNPWVYSALYQGSYLGTEGIITLIIISLPPVAKALEQVKKQAMA